VSLTTYVKVKLIGAIINIYQNFFLLVLQIYQIASYNCAKERISKTILSRYVKYYSSIIALSERISHKIKNILDVLTLYSIKMKQY